MSTFGIWNACLGAAFAAAVSASPQLPRPRYAYAAEPRRTVVAWIAKYDWDDALRSLAAHAPKILSVDPAWYAPLADGGVGVITGSRAEDPALLALAKEKNIPVLPLVMNVFPGGADPGLVRPLLGSPTLRQKHARAIAALAHAPAYAGIDLDYEGLRGADLSLLAALAEELAPLLHREGKVLAVSIEAQADESALPAWRRIAAAADSVRFMGYGQHRDSAGPVNDPEWVRSHLALALKAIPPEKLVQGLAVYGYRYLPDGRKSSGTWMFYRGLALSRGIVPSRDPASRTLRFPLGEDAVWFEDAESIALKVAAGRKLGVRRFGLWRLGGEDPELWKLF